MKTRMTHAGCTLQKLECVRRHPAAVYERPDQVVADTELATPLKIEALRRWRHDALCSGSCWDEAMGGGDLPLLECIANALRGFGFPVFPASPAMGEAG